VSALFLLFCIRAVQPDQRQREDPETDSTTKVRLCFAEFGKI
jgi:hypothetical protein